MLDASAIFYTYYADMLVK